MYVYVHTCICSIQHKFNLLQIQSTTNHCSLTHTHNHTHTHFLSKYIFYKLPVKTKSDSPARKTPTTPPPSLSSELMDASITSSSSTIVDESISLTGTSAGGGVASNAIAAAIVKPLNATESPTKRSGEMHVQSAPVTPQHQAAQQQQLQQQHQHINYAHSNSSNGSNNGSNGSSPDQEDAMMEHYHHITGGQNGKNDDKANKNLGNVQTYRLVELNEIISFLGLV